MNAVETTLRARGACKSRAVRRRPPHRPLPPPYPQASDGAKLKVTLSQLRSGRYSLKPPM